jgi:hypothetical protein
LYVLTLATGLAAVVSALLLAGTDASLPDSGALGEALVIEIIDDAPEQPPAAPPR